MAIIVNPTKISIPSGSLPNGYENPAGTNLAGSQPTILNFRVDVPKATVANASKSTTFDNIRKDATVGIEKQILDKITSEQENVTNNVTYNIDFKSIRTNQNVSEELYTNTPELYVCLVDVYMNIA